MKEDKKDLKEMEIKALILERDNLKNIILKLQNRLQLIKAQADIQFT